jgi:hypothetical protein
LDCAECRQGLAELRGTRHLLASWAPPQPEFNFHIVRGAAPAVPAPPGASGSCRSGRLSAAAALLLARCWCGRRWRNLEVSLRERRPGRAHGMDEGVRGGSRAARRNPRAQAAPVSASSDQLQRKRGAP